jgi:hypothetical protein
MQVNICPRIIQNLILNGTNFATYNINGQYVSRSGGIPLGLYATKIYKKDEIIYTMSGNLLTTPTSKSIHIGGNMHLEDTYGQYINHSFNPNIRIEANKLIAIKDINMYDEITFNYNESELEMDCPFEDDGILVCGKKNS